MRYFKNHLAGTIYRINSDKVELFLYHRTWTSSSYNVKDLLNNSKTINTTKWEIIIKDFMFTELTEAEAFIEIL